MPWRATDAASRELACSVGCDVCSQILAHNDTVTSCAGVCKDTNWLEANVTITKGVVEPDKACIMGCVINLCQE